jgi:hypothetical protein
MSSKSKRAKVRAQLIEKYWGNAKMDGPNVPTVSFPEYQRARREAWEHGMKLGFQAGLRMGKEVKP